MDEILHNLSFASLFEVLGATPFSSVRRFVLDFTSLVTLSFPEAFWAGRVYRFRTCLLE